MLRASISVIAVLATGLAFADSLQFVVGVNGYYPANAAVRVYNDAGVLVTQGYADGYGRVVLNVAPGSYLVKVSTSGGEKSAQVSLTGAANLRKVNLPD